MRHGERERERERERETLHPREMGRTLENIEVSHLFGLLIADVCILVLLAFIYHIRTRDHHLGDGLLIRTNSSLPRCEAFYIKTNFIHMYILVQKQCMF